MTALAIALILLLLLGIVCGFAEDITRWRRP